MALFGREVAFETEHKKLSVVEKTNRIKLAVRDRIKVNVFHLPLYICYIV